MINRARCVCRARQVTPASTPSPSRCRVIAWAVSNAPSWGAGAVQRSLSATVTAKRASSSLFQLSLVHSRAALRARMRRRLPMSRRRAAAVADGVRASSILVEVGGALGLLGAGDVRLGCRPSAVPRGLRGRMRTRVARSMRARQQLGGSRACFSSLSLAMSSSTCSV
jgi:hypothetical protein